MTNSPRFHDDEALAEWVKDTCLLFGTTTETAYKVAAMFIEGLKHELKEPS